MDNLHIKQQTETLLLLKAITSCGQNFELCLVQTVHSPCVLINV